MFNLLETRHHLFPLYDIVNIIIKIKIRSSTKNEKEYPDFNKSGKRPDELFITLEQDLLDIIVQK